MKSSGVSFYSIHLRRNSFPTTFVLIVPLPAVECRMSTSGNREYASMTTNNCSPVGKGPQKSTFTVCHGFGGKVVIWRGAG